MRHDSNNLRLRPLLVQALSKPSRAALLFAEHRNDVYARFFADVRTVHHSLSKHLDTLGLQTEQERSISPLTLGTLATHAL